MPAPKQIVVIRNESENIKSNNMDSDYHQHYKNAQISSFSLNSILDGKLIDQIEPDLLIFDFGENEIEMNNYINNLGIKLKDDCKIIFQSSIKSKNKVKSQQKNSQFKDVILKLASENENFVVKSNLENKTENEWIRLQTNTGFRFIKKTNIVLFRYLKVDMERERWEVLLTSNESLKLKTNTSSNEIIKNINSLDFIKTSQTMILNIRYINYIEIKTKKCFLTPPFQNLDIDISRSFLNSLKTEFNCL